MRVQVSSTLTITFNATDCVMTEVDGVICCMITSLYVTATLGSTAFDLLPPTSIKIMLNPAPDLTTTTLLLPELNITLDELLIPSLHSCLVALKGLSISASAFLDYSSSSSFWSLARCLLPRRPPPDAFVLFKRHLKARSEGRADKAVAERVPTGVLVSWEAIGEVRKFENSEETCNCVALTLMLRLITGVPRPHRALPKLRRQETHFIQA